MDKKLHVEGNDWSTPAVHLTKAQQKERMDHIAEAGTGAISHHRGLYAPAHCNMGFMVGGRGGGRGGGECGPE